MSTGKARSSVPAPAPREAPSLKDDGISCANSPACMGRRAAGRADKLCERCAARADYQKFRDPSLLPNRGVCSDDEWGALCNPGRHAAGCRHAKPAAAPSASRAPATPADRAREAHRDTLGVERQ